MSKRKVHTPVQSYEYHMSVLLDGKRQYELEVVSYIDDVPVFRVTVVDYNPVSAIKIAQGALGRVEADLKNGDLVLPDMGDYQVFYFQGR